MTSVHLAEKKKMTHYQTRTVVSLSQPEFCQKVDVKEAASLAGGERRAVMLRLLQHFTYDYLLLETCFFFSVLEPGRCIVRLCIEKMRASTLC